jgi:FAD/FMN-containing dehydrogenase
MTVETDLRAAGIDVDAPGPHRPGEFRDNVHTDFGRVVVRAPRHVIRPRTVDELATTLATLRQHRAPYRFRGTAHSSGGQVVTEHSVVDTTRVRGIVGETATSIDVLGSTTWLDVVEHVHPDRRPPILTDNLHTTIAGTLAVGGFGDTSVHYGLQVTSVLGLDWIAPDGTQHTLTPDDELFGFVLCGRGVLGAIARVRLRLIARPAKLAGHLVAWADLGSYLRAMQTNRARRLYEFVRATLDWKTGRVNAIVANFAHATPQSDPDLAALGVEQSKVLPASDRLPTARRDHIAKWAYVCPAIELSVPLDEHGLAGWSEIARRVAQSALTQHLPDGSGVVVVPGNSGFPLAPVPAVDASLLVALRPQLASREAALALLPELQAIASTALDHGGRIYAMSIEPERADRFDVQFGPAVAARWRALKATYDPDDLCNHGLLR